jgi:hypothetical protein
MTAVRVSQLVISKTNNRIATRLYSNVGTVSQTVRSGNGPYIARDHARSALLTVFSITQSDHSITLLSSHEITDLKMHPGIDSSFNFGSNLNMLY